MAQRQRCFLIDGMAVAYRAHFAMIRTPLVTTDGRHVSAAYGFLRLILKILQDEKPDYLAVVFDAKEKTFRHEKYADYKATREKMPIELRPQIGWISKLMESMTIPVLVKPGFEADDIIGTLALQGAEMNLDVYMVTGDKDFMQLVNDHIFLYSPVSGQKEMNIIDRRAVKEKWGVEPEQIIDLLALMGDSSDNVPGVAGIGEKSAVKLLEKYGSLENIFAHAADEKNNRVRTGLENGREIANLSRELVTIITDVPVEINWNAIRVTPFDNSALIRELEQLEFHTIIRELALTQVQPEETFQQNYETITTVERLKEWTSEGLRQPVISFDTETTSVDPMSTRLVGLSFSWEAWHGVYIPVRFQEKYKPLFGDHDEETILDILKPLLESESVKKVGQNIKFDALVMARRGIHLKGIVFDTMIAEYLLSPDSTTYKLDALASRYLHYQMVPIEDLIGKGRTQLTMDMVELEKAAFYAIEDADVAFQLYKILEKKLDESNLTDVMNKIEMPLVYVILKIEKNGMFIDIRQLHLMSAMIGKLLDERVKEIYELAGEPFNINSPAQLGHILFEKLALPPVKKTKTGYSTDVTVLEQLSNQHPLPKVILDYRMLAKLKSTYVDALPQLQNAETHRIHSSFNQTVAATGRLSSTNPNLQNIPIRTEMGREIRKAFIPQRANWKILAADYSQIELRVMAHLSGDEKLIDAFMNNRDIHSRTAALVFGISEQEVTADMRRTAKVINFGIMYGAGPFRISNELGISRGEAQGIINAYFDQYSGIKNYIDSTIAFAKENGFVETITGRRRWLIDINSENRNLREAAERMAINMPVQGSAADMIKMAMINIHHKLKTDHYQTMMISQVHDELIFEVPDDEIEKVKEMVIHEMETAMILKVPVRVDAGIGESWFEAH